MQTDSFATTIASELLTPQQLKAQIPLDASLETEIEASRRTLSEILTGNDPRLILIVGPCSIHDTTAALQFARNLRTLSESIGDVFVPVMRVYCEKPRTLYGWKGIVYDPDVDGTQNIAKGLLRTRELMLEINRLGVRVATEFLDPLTFHYYYDLVTWGSIGARTSTSQIHRQFASGLPLPVGFKNSTTGCLLGATLGAASAQKPHCHIGLTPEGKGSVFNTSGNPYTHLVLRGGADGPNYPPDRIAAAKLMLREHGVSTRLIVDCSHDNSGKDPHKQCQVFQSVIQQIQEGETS
ncbi:MAG: 3-deoxy-7-phosphoheptulonate synthase, partial [Chlamydiia bacterium]|nr:3-deoxy-7-phosphoheptulonate synthase [Chlamydiia bacterium]